MTSALFKKASSHISRSGGNAESHRFSLNLEHLSGTSADLQRRLRSYWLTGETLSQLESVLGSLCRKTKAVAVQEGGREGERERERERERESPGRGGVEDVVERVVKC